MPTASASALYARDYQAMGALIAHLLTHPQGMPPDWFPEATTYDLPRHYSESVFVNHVKALAERYFEAGYPELADLQSELVACGLPYDYARLGHALSSLYEWCLESLSKAHKVVSFASRSKPFLSVIEARESDAIPVILACEGALPLSHRAKQKLHQRQVRIFEHQTRAGVLAQLEPEKGAAEALRIWVCTTPPTVTELSQQQTDPWDAVCYPLEAGGLVFLYGERVQASQIQVLRKRTVSALLPGDCALALRHLLQVPVEGAAVDTQREKKQAQLAQDCHQQLQVLYPQLAGRPLFFCTGLAAEAAVFQAAAYCLGGQDLGAETSIPFYYAQNGYGGTGQLIGEILPRQSQIVPQPLVVMDTHGESDGQTLIDRMIAQLDTLHGAPAMLFLETPTNPQLQMHDFDALVLALKAYQQRYGITLPVLVDTTLAPLYPLFAQDFAQDWPFLLVKSGSKYFTKGKATLGVVMANAHPLAQQILDNTRHFGQDADAFAKVSQLQALYAGLQDLPERMQAIAENTQALAHSMQQGLAGRGYALTLYTMGPEQVAAGLATGVLSFYLPPVSLPEGVDLVDYFVDYLLTHAPEQVKNRVSYGQSGGAMYQGLAQDYIYVINPEESTQGALSQAVKDAQKKDNVQICRISVPAQCDIPAFVEVIDAFFTANYGPVAPGVV